MERGEIQDRVRAALLSYHSQEIYLSIDDLIGKLGLNSSQIYQALYRMQRHGELSLIKEPTVGGPDKITGIKLLRSPSQEQINTRIEGRKLHRDINLERDKMISTIPNLVKYMEDKVAVERARKLLTGRNLPEDTIKFDTNPIGEEAITLLARLTEQMELNQMLTFDLEAERRNVQTYKERALGSGLQNSN